MKNSFWKSFQVTRWIGGPQRALALLGISLIAACSTPLPPPAPLGAASEPPAPPAQPSEAAAPAPVVQEETPLVAFERMRSGVEGESVYFDFDKSLIKTDQVRAITDNARVASAYSSDYLTLQGNCDERGSREYNLALGQRRADAVKARLVLLGVPEQRIETMSFGKEKPRAQCHSETCWAENRRADFVHAWK